MRPLVYPSIALLLLGAGASQLAGKDKHKQITATPQDSISVESQLTVPGGPVTRFVATQHYDRPYVYVEHGPGQPVTLLDVSKPQKPVIVSQLDSSLVSSAGTMNLVAVAGTAALSSSVPAETAKISSQTIRLMDFSDPKNPKVTRQFEGVTAVETLAGGTILLANPEGVWILSRHLADDPEAQERYARKVIYGEN
jgi:hypothetical protein